MLKRKRKMKGQIEKLEDGSYKYLKEVVSYEEKIWTEEEFYTNFNKLKDKIYSIEEQILELTGELEEVQDLKNQFIQANNDLND
jgi:hypothetical protein